jgi:hypothetical protein
LGNRQYFHPACHSERSEESQIQIIVRANKLSTGLGRELRTTPLP